MAIIVPGRNQTVEFGIELVTRLQLPALACAVIAADRNSWYPGRFLDPIAVNQPDLDHALERIDVLSAEAEGRGIRREQIALVGFSQGACIACEYAFRHQARWGAIVIFTGSLIGPDEQVRDWGGPGLAGTPALFTNGDRDPFVPLLRTRQSANVFERLGADVSERVYPGREHEVGGEEIALARDLLLRLTTNR